MDSTVNTDEVAAMASKKDTNMTSELTHFPLLDLLPELQLKVYEAIVTSPNPIYARELFPLERASNYCSHHADPDNDLTTAQPAITKVSKQVRKDALGIYYSVNLFVMTGNVTERSCLVPFWRYPSQPFPDALRALRQIGTFVKVSDRCVTEESQFAKRKYHLAVYLRVSRTKKRFSVDLHDAKLFTPARKQFLLNAVKAAVGKPDEGGYDGIYLLKTASLLFSGLVCKDHRANWREIDLAKAAESAEQDDEGEGDENQATPQDVQDYINTTLNQMFYGAALPDDPPEIQQLFSGTAAVPPIQATTIAAQDEATGHSTAASPLQPSATPAQPDVSATQGTTPPPPPPTASSTVPPQSVSGMGNLFGLPVHTSTNGLPYGHPDFHGFMMMTPMLPAGLFGGASGLPPFPVPMGGTPFGPQPAPATASASGEGAEVGGQDEEEVQMPDGHGTSG